MLHFWSKPLRQTVAFMVINLFLLGCNMAETRVPKSPQDKYVTEVAAAAAQESAKRLDAELIALLRGGYTIESVHYYRFDPDIPWVAIAKNVQNQMSEVAVSRETLDWAEPGLDFAELYPQGKKAFAVAMLKDTPSNAAKFVGYYLLKSAK